MSKVCLISGARGMNAKTLARFLQDKDYQIILTYRRNSLFSIPQWFKDTQIEEKNQYKISFVACDIIDQNSVQECINEVLRGFGRLDELYLLAAMSHVGNSFAQKEYSIQANGQSYYYFLETLKFLSPKTRVFGAMSAELVGNTPDGTLINEESRWNPRNPYALGKQLGAGWIKFYRESTDCNLFACYGLLFNHSNAFRTKDFFCSKVCYYAAAISLGLEKELPLGNLDFYRDETLSDFYVEAMWKMLQGEEPRDYVLGNGVTYHGEEYLDTSFTLYGLDWKQYIKQDKSLLRPNEVYRLIADPRKAERDLGWVRNRITFKDHLRLISDFHYAKLMNKEFLIPDFFAPKTSKHSS